MHTYNRPPKFFKLPSRFFKTLFVSKPTGAFSCVLAKETLRYFPLLGGRDQQFKNNFYNFLPDSNFCYLLKQVGVIVYLCISTSVAFLESGEKI